MSGIGGQDIFRGRCGGRRTRVQDRGNGHYTATLNKKVLYNALGNNVFDYIQKGAAD